MVFRERLQSVGLPISLFILVIHRLEFQGETEY